MPAIFPSAQDSEYNLWRKILANQGGTLTYIPGEPEHSIKKKVLTNQGGAQTPSSTDTEAVTLRKILANQASALTALCSSTGLKVPNSADNENASYKKLLQNQGQNDALGYVSGMSDQPILKRLLNNMATAVDAATTEPHLTAIRQALGSCG